MGRERNLKMMVNYGGWKIWMIKVHGYGFMGGGVIIGNADVLNTPAPPGLCFVVNLLIADFGLYCPFYPPPPLRWSDGMRCCRSDGLGLCLFCCYQSSCQPTELILGFFFFITFSKPPSPLLTIQDSVTSCVALSELNDNGERISRIFRKIPSYFELKWSISPGIVAYVTPPPRNCCRMWRWHSCHHRYVYRQNCGWIWWGYTRYQLYGGMGGGGGIWKRPVFFFYYYWGLIGVEGILRGLLWLYEEEGHYGSRRSRLFIIYFATS